MVIVGCFTYVEKVFRWMIIQCKAYENLISFLRILNLRKRVKTLLGMSGEKDYYPTI